MTTVGLPTSVGLVAINNLSRCGQTVWPPKRRKAAPVKHVFELLSWSLSEAAVEHTDVIQKVLRSIRQVSKSIKGLSGEVFNKRGS